MKLLLILLTLSLNTFSQHAKPGGRSFILKPDAQKRLYLDNKAGTYRPGDTLYLSGYFKSADFYNLSGAADNFITITNLPGQTLIIGDSAWIGGGYSWGLAFHNCHFIELAGTSKNNFKITGSMSNPARNAYFNLSFSELSDNIIAHDISIRHGGTGVWAKTEVTTNPATWYPNTWLNNFEFYNLDIYNTYNEGMYIGHTATWWNIQTNLPYYLSSPDPAIHKLPIKLRNVKIHDNYLHDIGNDGIQTAAIDNLEVYNNEVTNWAVNKNSSHNGGILIGGRVKGFHAHDNYVHDGWGEMMQVYAEGGGLALINNNLLVRNKSDGVSIRGSDHLAVTFEGNTVAYNVGGPLVRINGSFGGDGRNVIKRNILAQPGLTESWWFPRNFVWTENNGAADTVDNKKYLKAVDVGWDEANYFQSGLVGYGYVRAVQPVPAKVVIMSNELAGLLKALKAGTYEVRVGIDSVVRKVTVRVE